MKPRVYVETTIPSFYFETRSEPDMVARREWTRSWWHNQRSRFEVVTSEAVIDELSRGEYEMKQAALALIRDLSLVKISDAIAPIVSTYIARKVMPNDALGDALHLALASYHKCDFLLTWNCKHLANANKFAHIRHINAMLGLYVPNLVTPLQLLGEDL